MSYYRPDLPRVVLLLVLIGLGTLLGLLVVWPLALLVDSVLSPAPQEGRLYGLLLAPLADRPLAQVALLAGLTLLFRLLQELLTMGRTMVHLQIGNNGLMRIRCDLFRQLQALHLRYHRSQSQGDSLYRLNEDTLGCQTILNVLIEVCVAAMTLVFMLGILLSRSVELTLFALGVVPLLVIVNLRYGERLKDRSREAKRIDSGFTSTIQRALSSISLVQAFGREADEYGRFRSSAGRSLRAWYGFHWEFACYRLWVGLIFGVGGALIFGYGGYLVHRDQFAAPRPGGMTVGDLMVFLSYLAMFYDPLCKITGAGASMQGGAVGTERVFEVLDRDPGVADAPGAVPLPVQPRTLSFAGTGFEYEPGVPVLREINATVRPGEMVAFVGSSGVGKSTLLNLLPRFFDPTHGSLALDGIDLRTVRLRDLRKHVALVLQDTIILPTSVAENIAYGRPDATEAEIRRAAELAGAAAFIESLPDGYETQLAEGGQNLSGGQKQRIAIARALLTEAPIIVLDEPTSALDSQHEQLISETLRALQGELTIVLVSHRLSTVIHCDQIFVMHDGRIVSQGTHDALLRRKGLYYDMARKQMLTRDDDADQTIAA